jgi:DNA-binding LacI/PurR family transcriptional regulator
MVPLFKKALASKKITAWVMANDFAATLALDFLKQKGIPIPERLSVIAFDDTFDAMEYRLTSYNFNNSGIVSWMLRHIMQPSLFRRSRRRKVFEPEGMIVERQTTGKAP